MGCRSLAFQRVQGAVRSSPTAISRSNSRSEVETIRARKSYREYAQGLSGSRDPSSCACVSGNRIGIHMVLVLRRKCGAYPRRCESAFVFATQPRTVKKASLKRGLQRRSGVRVQLPKNNHSRSITGIGTPISQSKSPFPITVSLNVNIRKENVNCARSFPPVTGQNINTGARSCGDVFVAIARKRDSGPVAIQAQ